MGVFLFLLALVFLILWIISYNKSVSLAKDNDSLKQSKNELEYKFNTTKKNLEQCQKKIDSYEDIDREIKLLEKKRSALNMELKKLEGEIVAQTVDISNYDNISSEECKNQLTMLKNKFNDIVKEDHAIKVLNSSGTKKQIQNNKKQILLCFNAQCSGIIDNISVKNIDTARGKIQRAFESINKMFEVDGVSLNPDVLEIKLEELSLVYAYIVKKEQEREEQKAIREQMLEEEKVRREIEREKAKIEKEESQFKNEITKLMGYLQKADSVEKQLYIDKIKELEEKLKLLEKDKENVLQREQNTRAGYVYVISNIGSFGENVYKIGMTRRLEPLDRVKELGDASVPFEFDVHAMIFSDDAPALETVLHQTFKKYQVNKVNDRKEFFKVPLDEIEQVVKENHNAAVTFTKVAEALQYRESLKLSE